MLEVLSIMRFDFVNTDLAAYPESVNVLDGISGDVRTPDKLINGENDTSNGDHMWLAPILPAIVSDMKKSLQSSLLVSISI